MHCLMWPCFMSKSVHKICSYKPRQQRQQRLNQSNHCFVDILRLTVLMTVLMTVLDGSAVRVKTKVDDGVDQLEGRAGKSRMFIGGSIQNAPKQDGGAVSSEPSRERPMQLLQ